jgi:hypothetical protein
MSSTLQEPGFTMNSTQTTWTKEGSWGAGAILLSKQEKMACCPWLTPTILATQEAEIRRTKVQSQPIK